MSSELLDRAIEDDSRPAQDGGADLERLLRERTDVFVEQRRVLHLAGSGELQDTLSALENIDYHCTEGAVESVEELALPYVSAGFDVVVCDGELRCGDGALHDGGPLREIARLLRPGGRAILTAPSQLAPGKFAQLVARAGFFVSRSRGYGAADVFLCVRAES
jgi:SAM-dependent methyltransferase